MGTEAPLASRVGITIAIGMVACESAVVRPSGPSSAKLRVHKTPAMAPTPAPASADQASIERASSLGFGELKQPSTLPTQPKTAPAIAPAAAAESMKSTRCQVGP